jgi:hypothetical protein
VGGRRRIGMMHAPLPGMTAAPAEELPAGRSVTGSSAGPVTSAAVAIRPPSPGRDVPGCATRHRARSAPCQEDRGQGGARQRPYNSSHDVVVGPAGPTTGADTLGRVTRTLRATRRGSGDTVVSAVRHAWRRCSSTDAPLGLCRSVAGQVRLVDVVEVAEARCSEPSRRMTA